MSPIPLGRFCWYELMTTDPKTAPGFYGAIAGWKTMPWQADGAEPYTMWVNGERPIGGLMPLPEQVAAGGTPPNWLVHISTPDLERTVSKATELGAEVLNRIAVPTVGRFAIIRDPQGAVFSAYQPEGDAPGHDNPPVIGEFSWNELATDGWEDAWSFYSDLFGWKKVDTVDMGEMGMYHMFGRGAHPLGGMFDRPPQMPVSAWVFYIHVPDIEKAVENVRAQGGTVMNGPMEVPGGDWVAQCVDPQGALFAIHARPHALA